jgi:cystathionine gamma-synthase
LAIKEEILNIAEPPYKKDLQRLAFEIEDYEKRTRIISDNTIALVDFLSTSKKIKKIYWALDSDSAANYSKISKGKELVPGIISVVFDKNLRFYYDLLQIAKGPSLGTEFTLAMPYFYMAHYDLVSTDEGRKYLKGLDINPELLRISVGVEPIDELISVIKEIL